MAKNRNDYFELVKTQVSYCVQASVLLEDILGSYATCNLEEQREHMHDIQHKADEIHHDILSSLSAEFITPIDQEDILRLVQIIDDVTDALDEVVLECHMFHIAELPQGVHAFGKIVNRCVKALYEAAGELKSFKKPEKLRSLLVQVNTIEGEADAAYSEAIYKLFGEETDARKLIGGKAVYDCLENCCDLCEHAADVIDQIIIKNT